METTKVEGMAREAAGEAKQMAGDLLGDPGMQLSGKAKALCGRSQELMADAALVARDAMSDKPLVVLGAAIGIGFALGALWANNRDQD